MSTILWIGWGLLVLGLLMAFRIFSIISFAHPLNKAVGTLSLVFGIYILLSEYMGV